MSIATNIAKALDMELPSDVKNYSSEVRDLTRVAPHEIISLDNPDLPDMTDIDIRLAEGEKQLEEIIVHGLAMMNEMFEKAEDVEPSKKARYLEVAQMMMAQTLSATIHKTKLQLEKKKMRMVEAGWAPAGKDPGGNTTNNVFVGSREDMIKMLRQQKLDMAV